VHVCSRYNIHQVKFGRTVHCRVSFLFFSASFQLALHSHIGCCSLKLKAY
jgi:hypothetical protein